MPPSKKYRIKHRTQKNNNETWEEEVKRYITHFTYKRSASRSSVPVLAYYLIQAIILISILWSTFSGSALFSPKLVQHHVESHESHRKPKREPFRIQQAPFFSRFSKNKRNKGKNFFPRTALGRQTDELFSDLQSMSGLRDDFQSACLRNKVDFKKR